MSRILSLISRGLVLWVIAGSLSAYCWPDAFLWTKWPLRYALGGFLFESSPPAGAASPYDLLGQPVIQWMFAMTMFAVGTVIAPRSFAVLAHQPFCVVEGLATQFTVMPALAFLVSRLAGFENDIALGFIIVGCAPGAMTSNVLTYLAGGDTAYSVTLTTLASILAVFITPFLIEYLGGAELGVTPEKFWQQLWTIAWTVATPLLLGLGLRVAWPRGRKAYEAASPAVAVVGIVVICCFVIQGTRDYLAQATGRILLGVVLVNALGFVFGFLLAKFYRLTRAQCVTLSIEVGMQNAGMGVVLAATTFSDRPRVAIPAAFFTIWCIITAAGLIALFKRQEREP
jgi:BASS family bile acid:Na+ symporter